MSSFQLTNSYFSRWFLNHQPVYLVNYDNGSLSNTFTIYKDGGNAYGNYLPTNIIHVHHHFQTKWPNMTNLELTGGAAKTTFSAARTRWTIAAGGMPRLHGFLGCWGVYDSMSS